MPAPRGGVRRRPDRDRPLASVRARAGHRDRRPWPDRAPQLDAEADPATAGRGRHARVARAGGPGRRRPDDPARSRSDRSSTDDRTQPRHTGPAAGRRPPVRRSMSSSRDFGCAPHRPWTIRSRPSSNRSSVVASSSRSSTGPSTQTTTTGTWSRRSAGPIAAGSPRPITTASPGSRIGARRRPSRRPSPRSRPHSCRRSGPMQRSAVPHAASTSRSEPSRASNAESTVPSSPASGRTTSVTRGTLQRPISSAWPHPTSSRQRATAPAGRAATPPGWPATGRLARIRTASTSATRGRGSSVGSAAFSTRTGPPTSG